MSFSSGERMLLKLAMWAFMRGDMIRGIIKVVAVNFTMFIYYAFTLYVMVRGLYHLS